MRYATKQFYLIGLLYDNWGTVNVRNLYWLGIRTYVLVAFEFRHSTGLISQKSKQMTNFLSEIKTPLRSDFGHSIYF